jgi:hypothetical protein
MAPTRWSAGTWPSRDLGAQLDHGVVKADQLVLEAEAPPGRSGRLAADKQRFEHHAIQLPGPMLVGVGQRGPGGGGDAQVTQLAFAASPPAADLAQGVGSAEWQNSIATNWPQQARTTGQRRRGRCETSCPR